MRRQTRLCAGLAAVATATIAADGRAFPEYRRYFQVSYGKLVPCELCHTSGGGTERNGYGRDWQRHKEDLAAFKSIESLDSDGDGISNGDEIRQGSNPGDEASTPAHPLNYWTNPRGIPIPREQIALVIAHSDSIEASEPALTDEQAHLVETRAKTAVHLPDRYPTLYFGVDHGTRSSVALFRQYDPQGDGHFSLLLAADAQGKVEKAVLFRAGKAEGAVYRGYLDCLVGHSKDDVPSPGRDGCPTLAGKEASLHATSDAVRSALVTLDVLLGDARSLPAAPGATSPVAGTPSDPSPSDPPAASASPTAHEAGLDLAAAPTTSRVSTVSSPLFSLAALAAIAALVGAIFASARWVMRSSASEAEAARRMPTLASLEAPYRLLVALTLVSLLLVQGVAASDAYVQTRVVHASAAEYFGYLSWPRLLGTSHAHLFGYAVTYGLLGLFVAMSRAPKLLRALLIATPLWCGIFDVLSWSGIKAFSPAFEWLTIATGIGSSSASLVGAYFVSRDVFGKGGEA
ncbi:MAG TPA: thrombospondin type 3 repeat-containing protein [Polyangiaceae bacterium]|jgi:hypothetical protein|nr:thrombospondin type 3 repeat-containing protein [Polyangiaceae bacterium]